MRVLQNRQRLLHQALFLIIAGVIFSLAYANHAQLSGPGSRPDAILALKAVWPWQGRVLLPWLGHVIFGDRIIEEVLFRVGVAFVCWILSALLLRAFARRLKVSDATAPYVVVGFLLILIAHYCLPVIYAPFYIHDLPAILFYLIAFLLLTSENRVQILLGGALTLLFYLNKESISLVLFHAFGWWYARRWREEPDYSKIRFSLAVMIVIFAATIVERKLLYWWLGGNGDDLVAMFYENGHVRVWANVLHAFSGLGFFQQVPAIGFAALIYVPFVFTSQSRTTRAIIVISAIPAIPLFLYGNYFTEIRVWNEFIPLFACLLATVIAWSAEGARPERAREEKAAAIARPIS